MDLAGPAAGAFASNLDLQQLILSAHVFGGVYSVMLPGQALTSVSGVTVQVSAGRHSAHNWTLAPKSGAPCAHSAVQRILQVATCRLLTQVLVNTFSGASVVNSPFATAPFVRPTLHLPGRRAGHSIVYTVSGGILPPATLADLLALVAGRRR